MKGRRFLKVAAVLVVVAYCSLLAYQTGVTLNSSVESRGARQVSEAPNPEVTESNRSTSKNITAQTPQTNLEDVFISVKTTRHYQDTRLPIILKTWFQLAKEQTWFFTDIDNPAHQTRTNGHMVNTNCSDSHERKHLCCKMSVEYDFFLESKKKWFCHFDDDNYVNVPRLVSTLRRFDPQREWYLGRTSVYEPVKLYKKPTNELMFSFWFATGGAGFCISRALALRMIPVASAGRFISICEGIRLPDDVSIGFIIEHLMKQRLTVVDEFHSHLEQMRFLAPESFERQISFSYSRVGSDWNVVQADAFDERVDPTRFLSLHCLLFPHFKFCPRR